MAVRSTSTWCLEIDPPVTPHELRHTAITHQCETGHHAWQIADWAGTGEKMVYLHYEHLLDELVGLPRVETAPWSGTPAERTGHSAVATDE